MPTSMKEDLRNEAQSEQERWNRLSSGKVYAVHLFVLVSFVKKKRIFLFCLLHRKRLPPSRKSIKSINTEKRKEHQSERGRKKKCAEQNITQSKTFTLSAVHTAKVSTKQDVWKLYFYARTFALVLPFPGRCVDDVHSTFLHELICMNEFSILQAICVCSFFFHAAAVIQAFRFTKCSNFQNESGKIEMLCNFILGKNFNGSMHLK